MLCFTKGMQDHQASILASTNLQFGTQSKKKKHKKGSHIEEKLKSFHCFLISRIYKANLQIDDSNPISWRRKLLTNICHGFQHWFQCDLCKSKLHICFS